MYSKAVKPLVENVLQGYNSCVFAYGATGTGKTYTMVGNEKNPGIMVRAFDDLFDSQEKQTQDTSVYLSYLEVRKRKNQYNNVRAFPLDWIGDDATSWSSTVSSTLMEDLTAAINYWNNVVRHKCNNSKARFYCYVTRTITG